MPYDPILSVGYSPRTNPAVLTKNETINVAGSSGTETISSTLEVQDRIQLLFFQVSISYRANNSGAFTPSISLQRNGVEFDRLNWAFTMGDISINTGINLLYSFGSQKPDILERGDEIKAEITFVKGGLADYDIIFNINIIGTYF